MSDYPATSPIPVDMALRERKEPASDSLTGSSSGGVVVDGKRMCLSIRIVAQLFYFRQSHWDKLAISGGNSCESRRRNRYMALVAAANLSIYGFSGTRE